MTMPRQPDLLCRVSPGEGVAAPPVTRAQPAPLAATLAIQYRPDIDGLRALAVVAVILFHARVPGFSGGYVGVDVFFVISGYLITEILLRSPLRTFYLRRARRILPALWVTSVITTVVACAVLIPH